MGLGPEMWIAGDTPFYQQYSCGKLGEQWDLVWDSLVLANQSDLFQFMSHMAPGGFAARTVKCVKKTSSYPNTGSRRLLKSYGS